MARWHFCNILKLDKDSRFLWQFSAANKKFNLQREESKLPNEALTTKLFAKDWENLVQPRLNVAWLPATDVFIRVAQLPQSDPDEMRAMVELQLEKFSPMPVTQVLWSYEVLGGAPEGMQTLVILIVARHKVEAFLGELEQLGYLTDRLELPFLDQLRSEYAQKDGIWIYPGWGTNVNACLIAWWQDGVLQNLSLVNLPDDDSRKKVLRGQLKQMIWSGEMAGWLTEDPRFFLVAEPDSEQSEIWRGLLAGAFEVEVVPPVPWAELANLTARRVAGNSDHTNLLPDEKQARYKQQFVDRLWMRGVGATIALYMLGVAIYFGWVEVSNWKVESINVEVANMGPVYTNALKDKEQLSILKEQLELRTAALDCWKAVSDNLPSELNLESIKFSERKVTYFGSGSSDSQSKVYDFNEAIRKTRVDDKRLFTTVDAPSINPRGGRQIAWNFAAYLEEKGGP